jgi:hypothetical protein
MNVFIGLDVSLASTAICVVTEHGKIVVETTEASEPEALLRFVQNLQYDISTDISQVTLCCGELGPFWGRLQL